MTIAHAYCKLWPMFCKEYDIGGLWWLIESEAIEHDTSATGGIHILTFADNSKIIRDFDKGQLTFYDSGVVMVGNNGRVADFYDGLPIATVPFAEPVEEYEYLDGEVL